MAGVGNDELAKTNLELIKEHHKKTGCAAREIKAYEDLEFNEKGYFCTDCKEEWLAHSENKNRLSVDGHGPVAHRIVPSFYCLQVSDTGTLMKWTDVNQTPGGLKPGDHIAWLRPLGYWHHAIVETVGDDSFGVIEWSVSYRKLKTYIGRVSKPRKFCCNGLMYKVNYPVEVEEQNPPGLVLMRARARVGESGYNLFSDNCEHFATFCKTGVQRCNQLFQLNVSVNAWIRKIVMTLLYMTIIAVISEGIEAAVEIPFYDVEPSSKDTASPDPNSVFNNFIKINSSTNSTSNGKDYSWIGASLMISFETFHLIVIIALIVFHDFRQMNFVINRTLRCLLAVLKLWLQSVTWLALAILAGSMLVDYVKTSKNWSKTSGTLLEILFSVLGGMVGNILGFFLFKFFPFYCAGSNCSRCCYKRQLPVRDVHLSNINLLEPTAV